MKVKIQADNMQQAMAMVREQLGRDAVLISSKKVDGRLEVLAASGYDVEQLSASVETPVATEPTAVQGPATERRSLKDFPFELLANIESEKEQLRRKEQVQEQEIKSHSRSLLDMQEELGRLRKLFEGEMAQLAWRESRDRQPNRMALLSRLELTGINHDLATQLVDKVLPCADLGEAWQKVIKMLLKTLKKPAPDPLQNGGVIAMVGATGVGKTTSAVKLAAEFARKHGRNQVGLITTDDLRVGQREQLLSLASSLGLSVQVAATGEELTQAMESFAERRLLIIDTAGVNQRQRDFEAQLATFLQGEREITPFLVLSATVQESVINETIRAFSRLRPAAAIVTKTDENISIGAILSSLIRYRLPVAYVGTGQMIPDDLVRADGEFFARKIRQSYRHAMAQVESRRKASA